MNVVGKVGSLISQGVYSVATPFHPFGGAVDVIVVKQQDGSFRSTPWYVRFGKFQGVLKGAEKVVRIDVNGAEANFHMYLDNSGEAYFVQEAESSKGSETNGSLKDSDGMDVSHEDGSDNIDKKVGRLEHSISDSGVDQLRDCEPLSRNRLERAESDGDRRYYDFHDDQSSVDEFSDFGSNRYEGLDGEHIGESQGSDSEVILVSVDGHVLTAPVSASGENTENVQLSTPQFHLGPGEGTEEFNSGDDAWAADYISKLNASSSNVECHSACSENEKKDSRKQVYGDDNSLAHELEVCEADGEHVCRIQENGNTHKLQGVHEMQNDEEVSPAGIQRKEVFQSCLELAKLNEQVGSDEYEETSPIEKVQGSNNKSPHSASAFLAQCTSPQFDSSSTISVEPSVLRVEIEATETNVVGTENTQQDGQGGESHTPASGEGLDNGLRNRIPDDHFSENNIAEHHNEASSIEMQASLSMRFEVSLCGKELRAGMGLEAAARVFEAHHVSVDEFKGSATSVIKNENLIIRYADRYLTWGKAAPIVLGAAAFGLDLPVEPTDTIPVEQSESSEQRDGDNVLTSSSSSRRWRLWPIPFRRVKTIEHTGSNSSSEDLFVDTESGVNSTVEPSSSSLVSNGSPRKQFIRTNVPTSEQIASLNLKDGQNMVTFSFCTRVLGKQQVDAHIYLWKWNARIVISDVDGTITKSDVLGQFMPLVGKDWSQSGVAKLFSAIKENGYQLLFLSARAIVQAYLTRSFLVNLNQDGKTLPNGPVVISPDGLFPSLYREVIRRAPHEFKIACLEDIRKLFPSDYNPFYAGFGNRDTDELSYRKMGIPKGKIFIINPKGEVAISHRIDVKSYTNLHTLVNDMFPPTSLVEQEDYNSWNFWKMPVPEIGI